MTLLLEVSGLTVRRGRAEILRELDWQVRPGEHWVVLGANGCGKTSLLRTLTGYMAATAGDFAVLGRRYGREDWRELRQHLGVVTAGFAAAIPPAETALETVVSGKYAQLDLWREPTAGDRRAAQALLRGMGLGRLAEREWVHLSQGERQRVLIARALMARPRLLILDEPAAGLDPVARERFLRHVERLARRRGGPALVLVTHHVEEITPAFTHALLLRGGRVLAAGPRAEVLRSARLSAAFGAPLRLTCRGGRYALAASR